LVLGHAGLNRVDVDVDEHVAVPVDQAPQPASVIAALSARRYSAGAGADQDRLKEAKSDIPQVN
jgi:hypothetical protein